jgi:hypothetical protein
MRCRFAHEILISLRRTLVGYLETGGRTSHLFGLAALPDRGIHGCFSASSWLRCSRAAGAMTIAAFQEMFRRVNGVTLAPWK